MMRLRKRIVLIYVPLVVLALCGSASGTDVFFRDISAYSPNRLYRLEAKSPSNVRGYLNTPFQRNFRYVLYRGDSQEVLWERGQGPGEASPIRAFVNDDGWVVTCLHGYSLVGISPNAETTPLLDILGSFPSEEREKHVHWTTAGLRWTEYSHWYFVSIKQRPFFCIRAWWDRRVLIDLKAGVIVKGPYDAEVVKALEAAEKESVATTLKEATERPESLHRREDADWEWNYQVLTAAHMVRRMRIEEALPLVEKLMDVLVRVGWRRDERSFDDRESAEPLPHDEPWSLWPLW
jgi:hypothetical protein